MSYPQFKLKRKHTQFHSLGILHLQLIADNSFVVTLGFDQKAQVLDAVSSAISSTVTNRNAARFTCCSWDAKGQLLFLADAMGFVQAWNIFQDKWVKRTKLYPSGCPILCLQLQAGPDWMFTGTTSGMKQWRINRDVRYTECPGHSDAVVAFAVIKDEPLIDPNHERIQNWGRQLTTSCRFFSVSLDNTLRCWDSYDMKAAFGFEERDSEITCVTVSKKFPKLITGHERGCIKVWGIYTGQYTTSILESKSAVTCITIGAVRDQEFVIAGDVDGNIFLWELSCDSIALHLTISGSTARDKREEVTAVMFCKGDFITPEGGSEFIAIGYQSGHLAIWSFASKRFVTAWKAHDDAICCLTRHGCFIFSGSDDATLRVWNCIHLKSPYELSVLRPPGSVSSSGTGSRIVAVDIVPQSGAVLMAAADGTIVVWDYAGYDDVECTDFESAGRTVHRTKYVTLRAEADQLVVMPLTH
ncbi:hypothetical protein PINS_up018103 [Pythium insidiosum]|nr:hypothetical protein PINS_up018103 [Pythium insidiosum]